VGAYPSRAEVTGVDLSVDLLLEVAESLKTN
jgi:hypothetical protein